MNAAQRTGLCLAAGATLWIAGCGASEASGTEGDTSTEDIPIVTAEEAEAQAAEEIDASNADEAYEKLLQEIEQDQ